MKKWQQTGKKALSVFMAIMMLMTAWVWVAPTEAEAANGSYYYKLEITVTNGCDGWNTNDVYLYHKANNGRSSGTTSIKINMSNANWDEKKTHTFTGGPISGFPCGYTHRYNFGGLVSWREIGYTVKISVGSSSSSYTKIYEDSFSAKSSAFVAADGTFGSSTCVGADKYPYVATTGKIISEATAVADIGIPPLGDKKDVSISERSIQYFTTDQYGVRYEPTSYTVSGVTGLTTGTSWSMGNAYKISASSSTTKSTTATYQTATAKLNWTNSNSNQTQHADSSYTFKVYNPRYKFTFNGNGGNLGTNYTYAYHGRTLGDSTSTATSNNVTGLSVEKVPTAGIKEGYTFKGIYTSTTGGTQITSSTVANVTADQTYYAQWDVNKYIATFYGTKVNDTDSGTVEYVIQTSNVDYGNNPVPPSAVDGYSFGDYDYTFVGWDKAISPIGVNGAEYRATYTSDFVSADYDAVNDIVDEANDIINGANYEAIYSEESRHALENALNSVVYNQGRTSQAVVDAYVPMIREAIDGLGRQKYSVLFIDSVDNSVIEMRYPVYYGDPISMPDDPQRGFTTTDHYAFTGWEPSETGDDITFVSKNMVILANFDKIAHTFTDTPLSSNCTTQAGVLYKCSCGYEYVEYSGSVGTEHDLDSEFTVDIAPNCTTVGSKSRHCSRCAYRADVTEIPALDHDFTDGYQGVVINPGCENDGAEVSECQRCGYDKYTIVPSIGHKWSEEVIAPTCTSSGYTVKTCSNCHDEDIISFVDPIAHTYTEATDEYIAPTCTGLGKKVSYCTCGAQKVETVDATGHVWNAELTTDYDATCTTEGQQSVHCSVCDVINADSITKLPANGHTWGAEVCEQKESCGVKGLYVKTCEVCQENSSRIVDALTHKYNRATTSATCETAGSVVDTCENCGDVITVEILQPLGHSYKNEGAIVKTEATCTEMAYNTYKCDICNETKLELINGSAALTHDFTGKETTIEAATCEEDGEKTVQCSRCDVTTTVIIPHLGHTWGNWTVTKEATNSDDGEMTRTCSRGCEQKVAIPAGGHEFDNGTVTKSATCEEAGTMLYKCTAHENCGITLEVTIPVTQHTVAQKIVEATCTALGSVEAYCSACNKSFDIKSTPAKAHNPVAKETVSPTCITSGYTVYACDCGTFSYNEYDASKPATGHISWTETDRKDATCTEDGFIKYECSVCKAPKEEILPKTGHNYTVTATTTADCTTPATKTYTCSCGDSYTVFEGTVTDSHDWNEWVIAEAATNVSLGYKTRTCKVCGQLDIEKIPATGAHNFTIKVDAESKAPTCTEDGYDVLQCSVHENCPEKSTVPVSKLGHSGAIVYTAPTCITEGSSKIVCSVCAAEIDSETIPVIAYHNFSGEGVKIDATCEDAGTMTYTCLTDGCTATKVESIPAKGHALTTTVIDATCVTEGTVVTTCENCTEFSETTVLAVKGHIWDEGDETPATCTEAGKIVYTCTADDCGETKTVTLTKLGHTWGDWTVTPSTNNAKGSVSHTCSICNVTESVEIPEGNHNLVVDAANSTAASCKAEGTTVFKCENHDNCGIALIITTEKTQHKIIIVEKEASCTQPGEVITKCEYCDDATITTVIPAKGHAYNTVEVTKEADCTTEGIRTYTCACGDSRTEAIPAKGHTFVTTVKEATCNAPGSVVTECSVCHDEQVKTTTVLPAMGHDYSGAETPVKSADCENDGEKKIQCTRCDATTTVILPKLGHNYSDWVETPATNDTDGSWYHKCANCGKEETLTIPAGGHKFEEDTTQYVAPKCNEKGKRVYKCTAHENCITTVTVELDYAQHTVEKDNKDATCTTNGYSKTYCSVCDTVFNLFEIPATQHSYVGEVATPATCTAEGIMLYTCSKCNDSYTKSIPMVQHNYQEFSKTDATCTSSGYTTFKCANCSSSYDVITDAAKGHTYVQVENSSTATCTSGGKVTLKCACGDEFTTDVPALGHDYKLNGTTVATCTAAATETYKCSRCTSSYTISVGEKAPHTYGEWKEIAAATEDALGYETRSCTACGHIELKTIDAIGDHNFDELITTSPAICTAPGEEVYACSTDHNCGLTSTVVIPATGHDETVTTEEATCDSDGSIITTCNNCDYRKVEAIPALGHTYGNGVVTPATCEDKGKIVYTCATCHGTYTAEIATNENAHQYETTVVDATCTEEGSVIAKCKLCDKETVNKVLPKLEHTWINPVTVSADCINDGSTTYSCQFCDANNVVTVPKLGHKIKEGTAVAATCTSSGYIPYTCENEGCTLAYNVYDADAPAKAHNYAQIENSSTATCTDAGEVTLKCADCGKEIKTAVPALGHDWGDWSTTKNPTATDEGKKERSCKNCTATESVTLPKLGHEMVKSDTLSTAATCTAEGEDVYVCNTHSDCGYTYSVPVAMKAHAYGEGVETTPATCTDNGVKTYTCTAENCDAEMTEVIPQTGHALSTKVNASTCEVKGSVVISCSNCKYEVVEELELASHKLDVQKTEPTCDTVGQIMIICTVCSRDFGAEDIPARGHSFAGQGKVITAATCTAPGEMEYTCAVENCGATKREAIPAKGHSYAEGDSFEATCTESGYTVFTCENGCGSSYSRLDSNPNGHSWKDGTVKTPAACESDGVMLVECNNCNESYEKIIPALGHSWGAWTTTKNPTATEDGEMSRVCIRGCGVTETSAIPALGGGSVTYTVTFIADGKVVATEIVNHNGSATAPDVSKAPDANGHYSYVWDTDFSDVTDNLTVTAIYTFAGHTFGNWVTEKESTCQVNGSRYRKCSVCEYTETETLALADHNYSVVVDEKAPTCTENGYKDVVCSVCGKTEIQTVKRLGHVMTYHERVYETCETEGLLAHYSCARCGKNFEDRLGNIELGKVVVNKKYHTLVLVEGFAPSCTSEGKTDYRHCTTCGMIQLSESIPALGHVDANGDHYCDRCSSAYLEGGEIVCTCNCHKVGFFNELIYKILRFFWQLFGKNKTCACGAIHY